MDPTLLAILSIFGGAALTAAAGFVGAAIQARREHMRWLREQRFVAYRDTLAQTRRVAQLEADLDNLEELARSGQSSSQLVEGLKKARERVDAERDEMARVSAPFVLLGPPEMESAVSEIFAASGDKNAMTAARAEFVRRARVALQIRD
jgi:hypothetical protein